MRNFYVLGSKRDVNGEWPDVLDAMVAQKVVDIGHGWQQPCLRHLYGESEDVIENAIAQLEPNPVSRIALKRFLNLRPGDFVAIKKHGAPRGKEPVLVIHAYARITQRNGQVYLRGEHPLNHSLNAVYLEHGKEHKFRLGYGSTIHRLTNSDHINQVFRPVLGSMNTPAIVPNNGSIKAAEKAAKLLKNVESHVRQGVGNVIVEQQHNKLQNRLKALLVQRYGEGKVFLEKNFVDVVVEDGDEVILYEVKPYKSVVLCVREALGQVLAYAWKEHLGGTRKLKLVVVGPSKPSNDEQRFLDYVKASLALEFEYEWCV